LDDADDLVKIRIDIPDDPSHTSESFWALPLGGDLYEVRNNPFLAFDLHFLDVVRATPDAPGVLPRIREVVRRSGHKNVRVFFLDSLPEPEQVDLLARLHAHQARYERASRSLVAIDVAPEGSYQAVCNQLWEWEQQGILHYETGMSKDEESATGANPTPEGARDTSTS
jgi:Domain of unknown function (DUF4265)